NAFDIQANLLANGNFSQGNTGFTTQYTYSPNSVESEGTYAIASNPAPLHPPNAWSFGDHTTASGLMFVTNGATVANTVMWQETVSVSTNTNYDFSGWGASWTADGSPARLRTLVNGVQVGSDFTLSSQPGRWMQFTAPWSSGTSSVATITVIDANTDGFGNDFVVDDFALSIAQAVPQLVVTTQPPGTVTAGVGFGLTVTAEDSSGHVDGSFNGTVMVALGT